MSIIDQITGDLDWRESELASMRLLIKQPSITSMQRQVLLRAAWAMLYAHYEGFAKFCLTVFYDEVSRRIPHCDLLPNKTKTRALADTVKKIKNMSTEAVIRQIEDFTTVTLKNTPVFPEVDTESNLWPDRLEALLIDADLSPGIISMHAQKIKTLVSRRNGIAHGELNMIRDVDYYLSFEETIYQIMYNLVFLIDERLERHPYC